MRKQISALADGEIGRDEAEHCLQHLKQNDELRATWDTYHLIGDALRGQLGQHLGDSFSQRLQAEPTVLAPLQSSQSLHRTRWYALSAAAGVAAVGVAAWVALPQFAAQQPQSGPIASVPNQATSVASSPRSNVLAESVSLTTVPAAIGVEDYLLAHQRFSPSNGMQGVAPYARTVTEERQGAAR